MSVNKNKSVLEVFHELDKRDVMRLKTQDLQFMKKLGYHRDYIQLAEKHGNFVANDFKIEWDLPWKRKRNFFYEFMRDALPIGSTNQNNFIYLINIKSKCSRVGVMQKNRGSFMILSDNIQDFLYQPEKKILTSNLLIDSSVPIFAPKTTDDSYKVDFKKIPIGLKVNLLPFGRETKDIFENKVGVFVAKKLSRVDELKSYKTIGRIHMVVFFSVIFAVLFLLISFDAKYEIVIPSILFLLFAWSPALMLFDRVRGKWQRL